MKISATRFVGTLAILMATGCSYDGAVQAFRNVCTKSQLLSPPAPTQGLGESCVAGGTTSCISGPCAHYGADPTASACSAYCKSDQECPAKWNCETVIPGTTGKYGKLCAPPSDWVPELTRVRPAAVSASSFPNPNVD